jgi:hypothetical protein
LLNKTVQNWAPRLFPTSQRLSKGHQTIESPQARLQVLRRPQQVASRKPGFHSSRLIVIALPCRLRTSPVTLLVCQDRDSLTNHRKQS